MAAKLVLTLLLASAPHAAGQTFLSRGFSVVGGHMTSFQSSKTWFSGSNGQMHEKTHEERQETHNGADATHVERTSQSWCRDGNCQGHVSMVTTGSLREMLSRITTHKGGVRMGLKEMLQRYTETHEEMLQRLTETRYPQPAPPQQPPQPPMVRVMFLGPRVQASQVPMPKSEMPMPPPVKPVDDPMRGMLLAGGSLGLLVAPMPPPVKPVDGPMSDTYLACGSLALLVLSSILVLEFWKQCHGSQARELSGLAEPLAPAEQQVAKLAKKSKNTGNKPAKQPEESVAVASAAASQFMGNVYANVEAKMQAKEAEATRAYLTRVCERAAAA